MTAKRSPRVALIGASGWLGRAIGPALLREGICDPADLVCVNRSGPSGAYAAWPGLRWETDAAAALADADVAILSVRPGDFRAGTFRCQGRLVVSLMAGVTCTEIARRTGAERVVRAMANAAVGIARSYTPWVATEAVAEEDAELVARILASVGTEERLSDEAQIETISALSGTGHAYPALLAGALLSAARAEGLPKEVAVRTVEAIVCDAAQLLRGEVAETDAIVERFLDYAGVTAAALASLRADGFEGQVARAIEVGHRRAIEMSREP